MYSMHGGTGSFNEHQVEVLKVSMEYMIELLGITTPIKVTIVENEGYIGQCGPSDDRSCIEIDVNSTKIDWMMDTFIIECITHEMIHVKQFETGRLEYRGEDTYWEGELFKRGGCVSYMDLPWEVEAWDVQYPLACDIMQTKEYKSLL